MTHIAKMLETFLKTFDLQVLMKNIVANLVLVNLIAGLVNNLLTLPCGSRGVVVFRTCSFIQATTSGPEKLSQR